MRIRHIVFKELWQRKSEFLASFAAVLLGIAVIVSVQTIGVSSEKKITEEMHNLGSNMLIIPEGAGVDDYYTADFGEETMPERYVEILHTSEFSEKVHEMIPKLSARIAVQPAGSEHPPASGARPVARATAGAAGAEVILTGVLPKDEFKKKPEWLSTTHFKLGEEIQRQTGDTSIFGEPEEMGVPVLRYEKKSKREAFDSISLREAILGSEAAGILGLEEGGELEIKDRLFRVSHVLEETGTVDDIRIFAHLHTVQDVLERGRVINAMEVVGCGCTKDLIRLGEDIEKILPGTKVITIRDIARTQFNTISMMKKFSLVLSIVVLMIGGAGIASYMFANVYERRREIGTLLAIGATPATILSIFLRKAFLLGVMGGVIGYLAGTGLALFLGPYLMKVEIFPRAVLMVWSIAISVVLNMAFSFIPAKRAAGLDPAVILAEE